MKARIPLIVISVFGLAAFSVAQDTEIAGLVTSLCTSAVAQDAQTKQALKIQAGSATREDVAVQVPNANSRLIVGLDLMEEKVLSTCGESFAFVVDFPGKNAAAAACIHQTAETFFGTRQILPVRRKHCVPARPKQIDRLPFLAALNVGEPQHPVR